MAGRTLSSRLISFNLQISKTQNLLDARNENNDSLHSRDADFFGYADVRCDSLAAASSGPSLVFRVGSEGLYEAFQRVDEARDAADTPYNENGDVEEDVVPQELPPQEFEVEKTGEQEAEPCACEAPGKTHQEGKMRDIDGHEQGEDYQGASEGESPGFEPPVAPVAVGEERPVSILEEGSLQDFHSCKERQGVGEQGFGHQEDVDYCPDGGWQVVCDDLLGLISPGQIGDQGKESLKDASCYVSPVHHAVELLGVLHVPLQGRQKDLRGVAEDNDANGDGEFLHINVKLDFVPRPVACPGEAVGDHQDVDHKVGQRAEQAELGDCLEVLQERAGQEHGRGNDGPRLLGDRQVGEAVVHQVPTDHHIEDAGHDQFNDLSHVHNSASERGEAGRTARVGYVHVGVSHPDYLPILILFIKTGNKDFPSVAANHRSENY